MLLKHQRTVILVTQKTHLVHNSDYVNILLFANVFSISFGACSPVSQTKIGRKRADKRFEFILFELFLYVFLLLTFPSFLLLSAFSLSLGFLAAFFTTTHTFAY